MERYKYNSFYSLPDLITFCPVELRLKRLRDGLTLTLSITEMRVIFLTWHIFSLDYKIKNVRTRIDQNTRTTSARLLFPGKTLSARAWDQTHTADICLHGRKFPGDEFCGRKENASKAQLIAF